MNILYGLNKTRAEATIVATDATIHQIVKDEIARLGNDADLNHIDVSQVTDMTKVFKDTKFNGDISQWDTSKVKNMHFMFAYCKFFNQPLNNWDVSNVTDMSLVFFKCENFNQPLNNWDVSSVINAQYMFNGCRNFNQPLDNWNVSNMKHMTLMFDGCRNFNQDLNDWDVSSVENMYKMFDYTKLKKDGNLPIWYRK